MKTALAGDEHALLEMAMATHAGMTTEEFEGIVSDWLATAKHLVTGNPPLPKTLRRFKRFHCNVDCFVPAPAATLNFKPQLSFFVTQLSCFFG